MCCTHFETDQTTETAPLRQTTSGAPARKRLLRSIAAVAAGFVAAVAIAAASLVADASQPTHELTLVARNMAFYLPNGGAPNPRIEVPAEEEVRMTIVNRDPGIDHDLAIESLGVASPSVSGDGSSATIEFRAPREPGEHEYVCRLHGRMMRGTLVVR